MCKAPYELPRGKEVIHSVGSPGSPVSGLIRRGFLNIFIGKPVYVFGTFSQVLLSSQVCFPHPISTTQGNSLDPQLE